VIVGVYVYSILAAMALLVTATLYLGPRLPEPFHLVDGGALIYLGILVYGLCLLVLVATPTGIFHVREAIRCRQRYVFVSALLVVVAYSVWVSLLLYGFSRSTDL
jgi:hypothetical protein